MNLKGGYSGKNEIFKLIQDKILFLDWEPGSSINEAALSKELGVSRTPIREALIILERERFIDIYPQRGTFVSLIDLNLVREIAYMRHILECRILADLARQKKSLQSQVEKYLYLQSLAVKNHDKKEFIKNDHLFHLALFSQAGHSRIWDLIEKQNLHTIRFHMLDFSMLYNMEDSLKEHRQLLEPLEAGDVDRLLEVLEIHHDHNLLSSRQSTIAMYEHLVSK
ncbi:GntR family transcriptional regulator [Deltaproteobacteria bacterium OttesenSCG-928-M10]|nr:GntR family transcriptional regulator [Deltaproteobacteria bacterium OttesenSCG-928-M10]